MSSPGDSSPFPVSATSVGVARKLSASQNRPLAGAPVDGVSPEETFELTSAMPLKSGLRRA